MPFSVLIIEDEGAASRYLRSLMELKCPDFRVVAVAGDGAAGLEAVRSFRPDLVITDIRMPGMDGLEFARRLSEELPSVPAVIVSGYQEFEYARRALGTGVVEYLLKPVSAAGLADALESLRPRLEANAARLRIAALAALIAGAPVAPGSGGSYWVALFRKDGLPSRFRLVVGAEAAEARRAEPMFFEFSGRDEKERFFLAPREAVDFDTFSRKAREEASFAGKGEGESTGILVFAPRDIAEPDLSAVARELRRAADLSLILGEERIVFLSGDAEADSGASRSRDWDPVLADRAEFCLANSRFGDLEAAVRDAVAAWRAERRPLIRVEASLRKLLHFLRRVAAGEGAADADLEYFLETEVAGATGWEELADAAWELARRAAGIAEAVRTAGVDAPAFFDSVLRFVDERYARPLSLGSVSETFRISETYLSKLFRKHVDNSFGGYLTFRRIEAAKRLMAESPRMPLKDIAACVGFQDPFYFSRVFKSVTGVPPSEYR